MKHDAQTIKDAQAFMRKYLLKVRRGTAKTFASVKHVSSTGMSRVIAYTGVYTEKGRIKDFNLTWYIHVLTGANVTPSGQPYGVRVYGCGMDMIFNTLYNLHQTVFTGDKKLVNGKPVHYSDTTRYNYM